MSDLEQKNVLTLKSLEARFEQAYEAIPAGDISDLESRFFALERRHEVLMGAFSLLLTNLQYGKASVEDVDMVKVPRKLVEAWKGMARGVDWNNGTYAQKYRAYIISETSKLP